MKFQVKVHELNGLVALCHDPRSPSPLGEVSLTLEPGHTVIVGSWIEVDWTDGRGRTFKTIGEPT
ncbi:MAG: hypothetical protein ACW99G_10270 [Candidatus Thorarchaeota archaeon]|jgi:hypothetical protein